MHSFFPAIRFSLRAKLTLFISAIVIGACCSLSWYLIDQHAQSLGASLVRTGGLLTERLASTSLFSVISHDRIRLKLLSEGILAIPEIRYVRFFDSTGVVLFEDHNDQQARVPPVSLFRQTQTISRSDPLVTPYHIVEEQIQPIDGDITALQLTLMVIGTPPRETIFDLLYPIQAAGTRTTLDPSLLQDLEVTAQDTDVNDITPQPLHGYVQIGISNLNLQRELLDTVRQVLLITVFMILMAVSVAVFFAGRLVNPLRSLTSLATRVSKGDLKATVQPTTTDEIGDLTHSFNHMVQSLAQRDDALAHQLRRLKTVNQAGAAITSSLDLSTVLDTVLELLVKNLGFERTLLMRYDPHTRQAFGARVAGVPSLVAEAAQHISIPILDNDTLPSDVLLSGKPVLIPDLEVLAPRLDPQLLQLARSMEATSLVMAPLISHHQRVLGFVGASRGAILCTQEDLDLLSTIGHQVGAALDNAQAYQQLETTMQTLEHRVQERTTELSQANDKLRELDRLKSAVVTSVSHELRTPLTSIQMHIDNILDGGTGPLRPEQKDFLTRVRNNTNRLRRIINEMLDLSWIESGQSSLTLSSVSFSQLLADVLDNLQPLIEERQLHVETSYEPSLPSLFVDADKLHQILTNLIHNAIKFTLPNGHSRVAASLNDSQWLQVCIADS